MGVTVNDLFIGSYNSALRKVIAKTGAEPPSQTKLMVAISLWSQKNAQHF